VNARDFVPNINAAEFVPTFAVKKPTENHDHDGMLAVTLRSYVS
jgi:hypothetical protein